MNNFLVLGISLVIITGPIAFAAFIGGYLWAKREVEKATKMTSRVIYSVDLPDDLPEFRTTVTQRDKRNVF